MARELYMLVEHMKDAAAMYHRFWDRGRLGTKGLVFVSAWVEENLERGYRVVQSEGRQPLDEWMASWNDLIDFEVHSVITPEEAGDRVAARLQQSGANAS